MAELTPKDAIILDYFNNRFKIDELTPWQQEQLGKSALNRLDFLISSGYMRYSTLREGLTHLTIPQIKDLLRSKSLPLSGKKADLLQRLYDNFTDTELEKYYIPKTHLTEDGEAFVRDNMAYIHNKNYNYGLSNFEIESRTKELKVNNPQSTADDAIWSLLNEKSVDCASQKRWSDLITTTENLAKYSYLHDDYENTIAFSLIMFYINLSGWDSNEYVVEYQDLFIYPFTYGYLKDILDDDSSKIDTINLKATELFRQTSNLLPFSYFSPESAITILNNILKGKEFNPKSYKPDYKLPEKYSLEGCDFTNSCTTINLQVQPMPQEFNEGHNFTQPLPFYLKAWFIILMFFLFMPVGIGLLLYRLFKK